MDEMDGESPQEYNGWVVAAMMILSAITVIGNVATIVIILAKKNLRCNPSNRFILSLSCADCFVGLFVMLPSALRIMVIKDSSYQYYTTIESIEIYNDSYEEMILRLILRLTYNSIFYAVTKSCI